MFFAKKIFSVALLIFALFITKNWYQVAAHFHVDTASLLFKPELVNLKVGEQFTIQVWIDTNSNDAGGVDAKIKFDPGFLEATNIETFPIFPDYPTKKFDNNTGDITISGIVNNQNELYKGIGQLATITFKAKKEGSNKVSYIYEPQSTSDSNIAVLFGNGDVLETVNTVDVQIATAATDSLNTSYNQKESNNVSVSANNNFSILNIVLTVGLITSVGFNIYLFRRKNSQNLLKEEFPHLHIPPKTN